VKIQQPADSQRSIWRYVFVGHVDKHLLVAGVRKTARQQLLIELEDLTNAVQTHIVITNHSMATWFL